MSKFSLSLLLLCWGAVVSLSAGDPTGTKCEAVEGAPSCVCRSPKGVIDLTKIASFDGTPRFRGLMDPNGFSYDYNPCASFKGPSECSTGVQVCQQLQGQDYFYAITDPGTEAMWIDDDGEPYVYYTGPQNREVIVHLVCDPSATEPVVTTTGDSYIYLVYEFTVRSVHACPSSNGTSPKCEAVEGAPSCVCKTPEGTIDLTKIASYDGSPRFTGIIGPNKYSYDYNPCFPFSVTESCSDVYACQKAEDNSTYAIASNSEVMRLDESKGKVFVYYTGPGGRETSVYLNCDQSIREPLLTTTGDSEVFFFYEFQLTSCHVCPGGCST